MECLFSDVQVRGLRLQFKYRDSFVGKISELPEISVVNGQTAKESRSKF